MYLYAVCESSNVLKVVFYVKFALRLACFIIPIILILKISLTLYKNMVSGKSEEVKTDFKNIGIKLGASVMLFLIIPIIDAIFSLSVLSNKGYIACWNNATSLKEIEEGNKTVYLNVNSNEVESSTVLNCFSTSSCTIQLPTAKRNENFTFLGWSKDEKCSGELYKESINVSEKEVHLFACYNQSEYPADDVTIGGDTSTVLTETDYTIYVGDSRTVAMCDYLNKEMTNKEKCVAEIGKSLAWFKSTAIGKVNNILNQNSGKVFNIIIDLSVNGIYPTRGKDYAAEYNKLKSGAWSKHNIIITSVTPVREGSNADNVSNVTIEKFNENLKSNLDSNIKYCDIYTPMKPLVDGSGVIEMDGIHYTKNGSRSLLELKRKCIK